MPSKKNDLLELRYDPTIAIVAAAEYDKYALQQLRQKGSVDTQLVDKIFFARHPERDFSKKRLGPKEKELVTEWNQIYSEHPGKSPLPKDLTVDQTARYLYLCHHEGPDGALLILNGSLTDAQAQALIVPNVPEKSRRDALIAKYGSTSKAYIGWLWSYIDEHIQPSGFRQ